MSKQEAYPITYGVLGLLVYTGAQSGYDLKQVFDIALAPMWNATQSQIYAELRRMDELGWVEMERQEQENRPDKKVYRITPAGVAALEEWQGQHPARGLQMRDEVLLRFIFGSFARPGDLARTLREAIADHEQRVMRYRQNLECLPANPLEDASRPDPYFVLMGSFAEMFEETYLRWLKMALEFAEERDRAKSSPPASQ